MNEQLVPDIHLRDYLRIIRKRFLTVIAFFVVLVTAVAVSVFKADPVYQATVCMQIDRENPNVLSFKEVVELDTSKDDYYQTQYQLLRSRTLAQEVIQKLNLAGHAEFLPDPKKKGMLVGISGWVTGLFGSGAKPSPTPTPTAADEDPATTRLINAFLGRVTVAPRRNTRLVEVKVDSRYPHLAADMANAMAEVFIFRNKSLRQDTTREATDWLTTQLAEARKKVEGSEQALQRYMERHGIISAENQQNIVTQRLNELNSALTQAKTERIARETRYQQLQQATAAPDNMDSLPEIMSNAFIQQLKADYAKSQNELSEMARTYKPKHPKIISLKSKMDTMEHRLKDEMAKIAQTVKSEYQVAKAKETSLQQALDQQKRAVQELNEKNIQYGVLQREVENNQRMYTILLNRTKETSLSEGLQTGNIRVVDMAEVPLDPIKPRKARSLALAIIVGLMGGVGLAFFMEYLDDTIKDPDDLEKYVHLPFLAPVPVIKPKLKGTLNEFISIAEPMSSVAETFRTARTNILFASPQARPRTILVTSPGPGEGKTTVAVNLAITMAQAGDKVLLLDADLRKPRLHKIFGIKNTCGVTNLLIPGTDNRQAVVMTKVPNLMVMPSGTIPPNPAELLGSPQMKKLLEAILQRFDTVIIDSAPLIAVTDATVLSIGLDGVIIVARAGKTSRQILRRSKKQLDEVHSRILGVILNFVNIHKSQYYYSPYYYYSYYGESDGGKKAKKKRTEKNTEANIAKTS